MLRKGWWLGCRRPCSIFSLMQASWTLHNKYRVACAHQFWSNFHSMYYTQTPNYTFHCGISEPYNVFRHWVVAELIWRHHRWNRGQMGPKCGVACAKRLGKTTIRILYVLVWHLGMILIVQGTFERTNYFPGALFTIIQLSPKPARDVQILGIAPFHWA
jgi:hypothetical protein